MNEIDRILAKREAFGAPHGLEDGLTKDVRLLLARFEQVSTRLYLAQGQPEIQNLLNRLEEMQKASTMPISKTIRKPRRTKLFQARHKPATRTFDCPDCGCPVLDCERCDKLICTGCDEPTLCNWC